MRKYLNLKRKSFNKKTSNTTILNYNVQGINKSTPKTYFFNKVNTPIDLGRLKVVEISITFLTI